jgi:hypothetical protein
MTAYTYSSFVTALASTMVEDATATDFLAIVPSIITYAEGRIYKDMNLLATLVRDTTGTLTANSLQFTLPVPTQGLFRVIKAINVVTPVGSTVSNGTRNPLQPVSLDFLYWTNQTNTATSSTAIPLYFAMAGGTNARDIQVGPAPGAAFAVEVVGEVQPDSLSETNTSTYLSTYYPELFLAASMVFASGWQKNFSASSDDPRSSQSWEQKYKDLLASADLQTARARFAAASWTSERPEPAANSQRG